MRITHATPLIDPNIRSMKYVNHKTGDVTEYVYVPVKQRRSVRKTVGLFMVAVTLASLGALGALTRFRLLGG